MSEISTRDLLTRAWDASDAGTEKIGVYRPSITNIRRAKKEPTTITIVLKTDDFTPADALDGMTAYLVLGTNKAWRTLFEEGGRGGERRRG